MVLLVLRCVLTLVIRLTFCSGSLINLCADIPQYTLSTVICVLTSLSIQKAISALVQRQAV